MINRRDVINKAINDCYIEMYKWAQPSINLEEYINNPELIKENDNDKFFERYYLSIDNLKYIVKNYINAYHIGNDWEDNIDLLLNYITSKDSVTYISERREYELITPLQDITNDYKKVISLINICRKFYNKDSELEKFNFRIFLGASPSSNKERVKKYWINHGRPKFNIKEFNIEDIIYSENDDVTVEEFIKTLK